MYKTVALTERNTVIRKLANLRKLGPEMEGLILTKTDTLPMGYKAIPYFENGVRTQVGLPSSVADAISGMNAFSMDVLTKWIGIPGGQMLRGGATIFNLPFILVSNPARDFQTAAITTGKGLGFIPWYLKGFASAIGHGKDFVKYQEFGGMQSGFVSYYRGSLPKTARAVKQLGITKFARTITNPAKILEVIGSAIEAAPRIGAYKVALSRGASPAEAAFTGRNATVDFARAGTIMRLANMWIPFINARWQGSIILGKAFKDRPMASIFNATTMVGLPAYLTYRYNRENFSDIYDKIPEYEKESSFVIVLGEKKDENGVLLPHYLKIPKGDIGRIFGNPVEFFMEWGHRNKTSMGETAMQIFKEPTKLGQLGLKLASDISPVEFEYEGKVSPSRLVGGIAPPPLRALAEVGLGKSFYFQSDIIPGWLKDVKTKSLQYTKRTPKTLRWLGRQTGLSPMMMEHFLKSCFGTGIYQVLEPQNIPKQLREKVVRIKGGAEAEEIYDFRQDIRSEEADIRVRMQHALTDILTGDEKEQKEARKEWEGIIHQVPLKNRERFIKYQINKITGKTLFTPEQRAWKSLTKSEWQKYLMRKMSEEMK